MDTIKFVYEKETKHMIRFKEVPGKGEPAIIGTLYIAKWYAQGTKEVEVSITLKS